MFLPRALRKLKIFRFLAEIMKGSERATMLETTGLRRSVLFTLFLSAIGLAPPAISGPINLYFKVFDEDGKQLEYDEIEARMTNDWSIGYVNTGTFDLKTLEAVSLNDMENSDGLMGVPLADADPASPQGIMVHWNTEETGYSSFLLDNGGRGFTESKTYIFNERLAYDARRQFSSSLARRSDFQPSEALQAMRDRVESCFIQLEAAEADSDRGKTGQECLDLVAQAMNMLLIEYGESRARNLGEKAVWGVTIFPRTAATIQGEYKKIDDLTSLFDSKNRWARIVMLGENSEHFERIGKVVSYAEDHEVNTMGQLFDSSFQSKTSLEEFRERVDQALSYPGFAKVSAWEVGNEINGDWVGEDIIKKVEYASERVKSVYPEKMVCLTFYWYSMQDTLQSSLFNWIDDHITQTVRENIDCVTLSIYVDQQPLGFLWDHIMSKLSEDFPQKKIMVGELAFSDPSVTQFFREGPDRLSHDEAAQRYVASRYASSFATPSSIGGGFWWYYDREMVGRTELWHALRDTYCSVYPGSCH